MLDQAQDTTTIKGVPDTAPVAGPITTEQRLRAGAFSLLASLLREPPEQDLLDHLGQHSAADSALDDTAVALQALADAALMSKPAEVSEQFHNLFVGVGRGELVPYGSWYQTGFLMEKPLGRLREDLITLGFERQENVAEPEDHAAALCEVLAMLITDGASHAVQQQFFDNHIKPWFSAFFSDLQQAGSAGPFYKAVGQFGAALTSLETQYQSMQV